MRLESANCHLHLNFLNEFDVVPRLDRLYVLSLVDLYRSRFALPPVDSDNYFKNLVPREPTLLDRKGAAKIWPLHAAVYVHPGDTILLSLDEAVKNKDGAAQLRATRIDHVTLGSLLFCQIAAHKVAIYLVNMEELCAQDSKG
ncbi:MAG: hypothetical protein L6R39_006051 [Caloplaca ligustica]|nr:MAG: hypothetical protein L6R39_006051 [Caloplaca ligustica]